VRFADVAQLVEHSLGKGEVIGSIPIISSILSADVLVESTDLVSAAAAERIRSRRKAVIGAGFFVPIISSSLEVAVRQGRE
jgi:hypothetical protein